MQSYSKRFPSLRSGHAFRTGLNLPQTFSITPKTLPLTLHTFAIRPQALSTQVHTARIPSFLGASPFHRTQNPS